MPTVVANILSATPPAPVVTPLGGPASGTVLELDWSGLGRWRRPSTFALPGVGQGFETRDKLVVVVGLPLLHGGPHLLDHHRTEHVENLVALVPEADETLRRLPGLGRLVVPQLVGDDLVNCEVQARVHGLTPHRDLLDAVLDGGSKFGVFGLNEHSTVVGIVRVQKVKLGLTKAACPRWHHPTLAFGLVHAGPDYAPAPTVLPPIMAAG